MERQEDGLGERGGEGRRPEKCKKTAWVKEVEKDVVEKGKKTAWVKEAEKDAVEKGKKTAWERGGEAIAERPVCFTAYRL